MKKNSLIAALKTFKKHLNPLSINDTKPSGINEKMVWNNRPSVSMRGVAKYETLPSAKIAKMKGNFPDLNGALCNIFKIETVKSKIDFTDISGVASVSLEFTHDELEYVDLEHFVEEDCIYYTADQTIEGFNSLFDQVMGKLNKERNFTIYGWSHQLFQSSGDVAHRTCAAVHIARKHNVKKSIDDAIEFITIDAEGLRAFNDQYQSYIVPNDQTDMIEGYFEDNGLSYVKLDYPSYFPCRSFIYVFHQPEQPKDFYIDNRMNHLNRIYTDFNKVLLAQYHLQKRNPVLKKYLGYAASNQD